MSWMQQGNWLYPESAQILVICLEVECSIDIRYLSNLIWLIWIEIEGAWVSIRAKRKTRRGEMGRGNHSMWKLLTLSKDFIERETIMCPWVFPIFLKKNLFMTPEPIPELWTQFHRPAILLWTPNNTVQVISCKNKNMRSWRCLSWTERGKRTESSKKDWQIKKPI